MSAEKLVLDEDILYHVDSAHNVSIGYTICIHVSCSKCAAFFIEIRVKALGLGCLMLRGFLVFDIGTSFAKF